VNYHTEKGKKFFNIVLYVLYCTVLHCVELYCIACDAISLAVIASYA
jgi:hypothetical protein